MSTTNSTSRLTSLLTRLQALLIAKASNMHSLVGAILSFLLSWRTLLFLLAITNLKSLPLSWHVRLFINMARYGNRKSTIRKRLQTAAAALPPPSTITPSNPKPLHPIFRPVSLPSHAPLGECDYNLHKSNSTYFSDLDHSRGNLVASLVNPTMRLNALVPHGIRKGLVYPILGSVHTSFLREIKPYERYEVRSRILGWDRKWLVIGSWFVRRATKAELKKDRASGKDFLKGPVGEEEVVFACVLNKYVLKAGRITVPPELALAGSGWFPVRPEATASIRAYQNSPSSTNTTTSIPNKAIPARLAMSNAPNTPSETNTGTNTPALGPAPLIDSAATAVQTVAIEAGRRLSFSADKAALPTVQDEEKQKQVIEGSTNWDTTLYPGWTWEEIDEERKRGLQVAEMWMGMDVMLRKEYEGDMERGIWYT